MSNSSRCWQCGSKLHDTFAQVEYEGTVLRVHKSCKDGAVAVLFPSGFNERAVTVTAPKETCEWADLMRLRA